MPQVTMMMSVYVPIGPSPLYISFRAEMLFCPALYMVKYDEERKHLQAFVCFETDLL
jgi:hypothetical protein